MPPMQLLLVISVIPWGMCSARAHSHVLHFLNHVSLASSPQQSNLGEIVLNKPTQVKYSSASVVGSNEVPWYDSWLEALGLSGPSFFIGPSLFFIGPLAWRDKLLPHTIIFLNICIYLFHSYPTWTHSFHMFFFCNLGLIIYTGLMSLRSRFRMSLKILMICIDLQSMLLDSREDRGGRE